MKLVLKGHDERYVVEQGMLNLFPGERPVYEPIGPEDDTWARVSLREEADGCTVEVELSWRGTAATHRLDAPLTGDEFQREGLRRRAIGRCFFLAAHGVTGTAPPWGMLTGVRPVKLPTREMAAGATPEQARASLERDCYVSPERAELAVDCAQASLNAQRTLKEDEVSLYVGIPFCPTRCAYCSFVSADVGRTLKLLEPYLDALLEEIDALGRILERTGKGLRTFYMGGGTPTTLSAVQLDRLLTRCREVLPLELIQLPGDHNVENYMAAIAAVDGLVPDRCVRAVARRFQGVEHRIEFVRELDGVRWYNDSIGTSPSRTTACLESFDRKVVLIAGGYDKGIPFTQLGMEIVDRVKALILTGDTASAIRSAAEQAPSFEASGLVIREEEDLAAAVRAARETAREGDVVVLSPACAAFDQFKNFMERGQAFKRLVQAL